MAYKPQILNVAAGGTGDASLTAYAVLCGGTTSTGVVQSIASVGSSGQVLTSNGASALPTFQTAPALAVQVNVQAITATGSFTYTPTSGMQYVIVELCGGGGGGGGVASTTANVAVAAAGGGGAYAKFLLTAAQVGSSLSGSVGIAGTAASSGANAGGNGGNTTLATSSPWTAGGGSGGGGSAATTGLSVNATSGGTVTTGTGTIFFTAAGGQGGGGGGNASSLSVGCAGGSSILGAGGPASTEAVVSGVTAGAPGFGYGAGAGGAVSFGNNSASAGTAGQTGIAIFTEFI